MKAGVGGGTCNGDKYNCRVEALKAINDQSSTSAVTTTSQPAGRSVSVRTLDCSPRTPTTTMTTGGRVVLVAAGSGAHCTAPAARWDCTTVPAPSQCRRKLHPDLVTDQSAHLSTFGKTLPAPSKRTLCDVTSATPDVKV